MPQGSSTKAEMDDRLKTLFEYTKWHIGLYTGLVTALIAILQLYGEELSAPTRLVFLCSLFFIFLAGIGGGMVGSSIPYCLDFDTFMRTRLKPWKGWEKTRNPGDAGGSQAEALVVDSSAGWSERLFTGTWWTHFEHRMFWIGILIAVLGIGAIEVSRLWSGTSAPAIVLCFG